MEPKSLFYFLLSETFTFFRSFPRLPIRGLYCQSELSSRPCWTLREMMGINKANVDCLRWKNCHVSKSALTVNNNYDWFMLTLAESFYTSRKTPSYSIWLAKKQLDFSATHRLPSALSMLLITDHWPFGSNLAVKSNISLRSSLPHRHIKITISA